MQTWPCFDRPKWLTRVSTWAAGWRVIEFATAVAGCCCCCWWCPSIKGVRKWWWCNRWGRHCWCCCWWWLLKLMTADDANGTLELLLTLLVVVRTSRTRDHRVGNGLVNWWTAVDDPVEEQCWKNKCSLSGLGVVNVALHRWQTYRSPPV